MCYDPRKLDGVGDGSTHTRDPPRPLADDSMESDEALSDEELVERARGAPEDGLHPFEHLVLRYQGKLKPRNKTE